MVGGKDYVDQCLSDELIQQNLVRNIKGAAEIGGKVQITLSDKASKEALQKKLFELGVPEEELKSLQVIEEKKLLKNCKQFFQRGDPRGASKYQQLLGFKDDPEMRGMYYDTIKLLTIYNAPKNQVVEFADLDQQVDIKQNPNFSIGNDVGLYTSMHLGQNPSDSSYRRHDMNKDELLKYSKDNSNKISNRPYTNERSYLVGRGNDERIMKILFYYVGNIPHFFINDYFSSLSYEEKVKIGEGTSDEKMAPELRETLIKRAHIDFNQTSLLPRERAQGKEVGFEHLEKEKTSKKKKDKSVVESQTSEDFFSAKNEQIKTPLVPEQQDSTQDFAFESPAITPPSKDQNSSSIPSGTVAALTFAALATGYLLRRIFGGVNAGKLQESGGKDSKKKGR